MFELLIYTKRGDKQIAKLKSPLIPRIGETISLNANVISYNEDIIQIHNKIYDIEYRFNKDFTLEHILIFLDM